MLVCYSGTALTATRGWLPDSLARLLPRTPALPLTRFLASCTTAIADSDLMMCNQRIATSRFDGTGAATASPAVLLLRGESANVRSNPHAHPFFRFYWDLSELGVSSNPEQSSREYRRESHQPPHRKTTEHWKGSRKRAFKLVLTIFFRA